tara:strand:+ start:338 stop:775 length:438 start_codon:yes stop_codon:yes gene_type:complete
MRFQHRFVDFMPDIIDDGILYISLDYGTVIHKCPCGCGSEVNTPLTPTGWKMIYNGEAISLKPSVGNWSFDCKSHYWITNNEVEWSLKWSDETIREVRAAEDSEREEYYNKIDSQNLDENLSDSVQLPKQEPAKKSWLKKLIFWK